MPCLVIARLYLRAIAEAGSHFLANSLVALGRTTAAMNRQRRSTWPRRKHTAFLVLNPIGTHEMNSRFANQALPASSLLRYAIATPVL